MADLSSFAPCGIRAIGRSASSILADRYVEKIGAEKGMYSHCVTE
jgi:hypothetical protein